jgi:mRNA interferase YafQ
MILLKTPAFIKSAKSVLRKNPLLAADIEDTLIVLSQNPFDPFLKTLKLKENLNDSYACRVNFEIRIIFQIIKETDIKTNLTIDVILLEAIGTHDEVY